MRVGCPALILAILPFATAAHHRSRSHSNIARSTKTCSSSNSTSNGTSTSSAYKLTDIFKGQSFFDNWDFFTGNDPTQGMVSYQSQSDAQTKGLAYVQSDNTSVIRVDGWTKLGAGQNRDSVRISSKKTYSGGLFVADFAAMPVGCGTWPAWWSTGPNWPNAGEIDVVEGVNGIGTNQFTLHTGETCNMSKSSSSDDFLGALVNTVCESTNNDNTGCGVTDTDQRSFGASFNNASGGVFAHLWNSQGIKMWHFARSEVPNDILESQPNPDSWGTPQAFLSSADCDISKNFYDHGLTLNTDVCGGWAAGEYPQSGCPGTCSDAVQDPSNFVDALWKINYIAVYNGVAGSS